MSNQEITINIFDNKISKSKRLYVIKIAVFWTLWMCIGTLIFQCLIDSDFSKENILSQFAWIKTPFMIYLHLMSGYLIAVYLWKRKQKKSNNN